MNTMKTIKIGIIGAGRIGKVHAENIAKFVPEMEIKIIADPFMSEETVEFLKRLRIPNIVNDVNVILNDPEIKAVMNMLWSKISASHVALAGQCYNDEKIAPAIADGKTMLNIGSDLQYLIWGTCSLVEKVRKFING